MSRALSSPGFGSNPDTRRDMKLYAAFGASLLYTRGPVPETGAAWTRALEIAERLADAEYRLRALWGLWTCQHYIGAYRTALALARRFSDLAATGADPADLLIADRMMGSSLHYLGDQSAATVISSVCSSLCRPRSPLAQGPLCLRPASDRARGVRSDPLAAGMGGSGDTRGPTCSRGGARSRSSAFAVLGTARGSVPDRALHRRPRGA
jgi:hypothetical protein